MLSRLKIFANSWALYTRLIGYSTLIKLNHLGPIVGAENRSILSPWKEEASRDVHVLPYSILIK
jgi:hypothetical protein